MRKYFKSKKIVFSHNQHPGELVAMFTHGGKRYVRVVFTNRAKYKGTWPMTDILRSNVTGIRKLPSPFKKWAFKLIGLRAKPPFYTFK